MPEGLLDGRLREEWATMPLHRQRAIATFVIDRAVVLPVGRGRRALPEETVVIEWASPGAGDAVEDLRRQRGS